jgi:hypothetical protein
MFNLPQMQPYVQEALNSNDPQVKALGTVAAMLWIVAGQLAGIQSQMR